MSDEELVKWMLSNCKDGSKHAHKLMRIVDSDGSNSISLAEWNRGWSAKQFCLAEGAGGKYDVTYTAPKPEGKRASLTKKGSTKKAGSAKKVGAAAAAASGEPEPTRAPQEKLKPALPGAAVVSPRSGGPLPPLHAPPPL